MAFFFAFFPKIAAHNDRFLHVFCRIVCQKGAKTCVKKSLIIVIGLITTLISTLAHICISEFSYSCMRKYTYV